MCAFKNRVRVSGCDATHCSNASALHTLPVPVCTRVLLFAWKCTPKKEEKRMQICMRMLIVARLRRAMTTWMEVRIQDSAAKKAMISFCEKKRAKNSHVWVIYLFDACAVS
jgi:hypothetical protein